jgi:alcohol dehydrogenase (NADP+)
MEKLVKPDGQVRFIGISNYSPKQLDALLAVATIKPKVHQFELHPYLQQNDFVKSHHEKNISMMAYAPLGNTSPFYAFANMENPTHPPILTNNPTMRAIGKEIGCSAAQVALAWNLRRGVSVIPKAIGENHQVENIKVLDKCVPKLTDEHVQKIETISKQYIGRMNNPCWRWSIACFEGLQVPNQGR